jgi:hypothetical protein
MTRTSATAAAWPPMKGYEIEYLAETTGITRTQAIALIQKHGNDRATLLREARKLGK